MATETVQDFSEVSELLSSGPGIEQAKKFRGPRHERGICCPGLGWGSCGVRVVLRGHRPSLPTHPLRYPGLAQTQERGGWGIEEEGLRHLPD